LSPRFEREAETAERESALTFGKALWESTRTLSSPSFPLGVIAAIALLGAAKPAHAESAPQPSESAASNANVPGAGPSLRGFDALATVGIGAHTGKIIHLELAPYGATFGVDLGYSWRSGFRLGGYFFKSLGSSVVQHRDPRIGREYDFTADSSTINGGVSLGWGVPLYGLILRYELRLGVTAMQWDFHGTSGPRAGFNEDSSPTLGMHVAPGVALLWPHGLFLGGVGFEYLAQIKDTIPSGFIGTLFLGVRL
jgi:hypothetical protein